MNDIVEHASENLPQITTEKAMIQRIAEMASDPKVDPDKIEKLLNIQIKMLDRQAKMDFDQALARVQKQMPRITKRGEIKNRAGEVVARYMKYEDIDMVIRPILQAEDFSLVHNVTDEGGRMKVETFLKHKSGHQESVNIVLPYDKPNALKSEIQAAAGTSSVGKRNNVCNLLNLTAEGEDDDGFLNYIKIDDSQKEEIIKALRETGADGVRFLQYMGVASVDEIPMKDYAKAYMALKRKVLSK